MWSYGPMRILALVAWFVFAAAFVVGCKGKPPPPPKALIAAMEALDEGAARGVVSTEVCEEFQRQASAWRPKLHLQQAADFERMTRDIAASCAHDQIPRDWPTIKLRLDRVVAGKAPQEGPRYQLDAPSAVVSAQKAVDAALDAGDGPRAERAMADWAREVCLWSEKMLGARAARMNEVCERQRAAIRTDRSISALRVEWNNAQQRIAPDGQ